MGKVVSKEHFRAYIYNKDGSHLVNSWADYCAYKDSGRWYDEKSKVPKPRSKPKPKVVEAANDGENKD